MWTSQLLIITVRFCSWTSTVEQYVVVLTLRGLMSYILDFWPLCTWECVPSMTKQMLHLVSVISLRKWLWKPMVFRSNFDIIIEYGGITKGCVHPLWGFSDPTYTIWLVAETFLLLETRYCRCSWCQNVVGLFWLCRQRGRTLQLTLFYEALRNFQVQQVARSSTPCIEKEPSLGYRVWTVAAKLSAAKPPMLEVGRIVKNMLSALRVN